MKSKEQKYQEAILRTNAHHRMVRRVVEEGITGGRILPEVKHRLGIRQTDTRYDEILARKIAEELQTIKQEKAHDARS